MKIAGHNRAWSRRWGQALGEFAPPGLVVVLESVAEQGSHLADCLAASTTGPGSEPVTFLATDS